MPDAVTASRHRSLVARWATILLGAFAAVLLVPAPALADPPGPTHYRSSVTAVEGPDDAAAAIDAEVIGGDAYLTLRVPAGTTVEVPGYDDEPYLRFDANGTVAVNQRSPARWLNDARYGAADVDVPADADAEAPPAWEVVASGGEYSWHDHRIHFMSPGLPPGVDPAVDAAQPVLDWAIPMAVDGQDVEVVGELVWHPGPSPVWPGLAAAVALLGGIGLARSGRALVPALVGAALLSGALGIATTWSLPTGADIEPALLVLPGTLLAVLAAAWASRRQHPARARWLVAAAGIPAVVWGLVQVGALTRPIVPGPVPVEVVRASVALVLAAGVAAVIVGARALLDVTRASDEVGESSS